MSTNAGPVIFIKNEIISEKYYAVLDSMVSKNLIKPSYKLIVDGLSTATLYAEHVVDKGFFVRFFDACDSIEGKTDPDYKKAKPIKLGKITRYNRLKDFQKVGLLQPFSDTRLVKQLYTGRANNKISVYSLVMPTMMNLGSVEKDVSEQIQRTSEYKAARKAESLEATQMDFGFANKPLEKLGSLEILATYFSEFVRPDQSFNAPVIQGKKKVRNPETGELGNLDVETASSTDSEIMVADDMVLLNYFYSSIQERLNAIKTTISAPFENLFRFDKREILLDFEQSDSGGTRDVLDRQVKRITNTKFNLEADSAALWLVSKLGLVDSQGKPYAKAAVRLLIERGEQIDATSESHNEILKSRKSRRYVDVSLPPFIENLINDSIKEWNRRGLEDANTENVPFLRMYDRDKTLLQNQDKGIVWILNDYLSSMLARPGFKHGPVDLVDFAKRFSHSILDKNAEKRIVQLILRAFTSSQSLLYCKGYIKNSRRIIRLKQVYALLDNKFILRIENTTPGYTETTKVNRVTYSLTAVRLDREQAHECADRNDLILKDWNYCEDDSFISFAKGVFEKADITAAKYKNR